MRTIEDIRVRTKIIRKATPDVRENLFEMQNRLCDLCGHPIQDLILAELDHSIPVIYFAQSLLDIESAICQANSLNNLRIAHVTCNHTKKNKTREEWFSLGLNKREAKQVMTAKELVAFQFRLGASGRLGKGGRKSKENGKGIFAPDFDRTSGGRKTYELKVGIFAPQVDKRKRSHAAGSIGGPRTKELKVGIYAPNFDRSSAGKKGGRRRVELYGRAWPGTTESQMKGARSSVATGYPNRRNCGKGSTNGFRTAPINNHIRWHVRRGISNINVCNLCFLETVAWG